MTPLPYPRWPLLFLLPCYSSLLWVKDERILYAGFFLFLTFTGFYGLYLLQLWQENRRRQIGSEA